MENIETDTADFYLKSANNKVDYVDKLMDDFGDNLILLNVDDEALRIHSYLMQQAHEFLLKYILKRFNISFKKTHNLETLLKSISTYIPIYCEPLKRIANKLTKWESSSRYDANFSNTGEYIRECIYIFDLMINEIEFSIDNLDSEDFNYCYDYIKSKGFKSRGEILRCMEDIVQLTITLRPFTENVYTTMKNKLDFFFHKVYPNINYYKNLANDADEREHKGNSKKHDNFGLMRGIDF